MISSLYFLLLLSISDSEINIFAPQGFCCFYDDRGVVFSQLLIVLKLTPVGFNLKLVHTFDKNQTGLQKST